MVFIGCVHPVSQEDNGLEGLEKRGLTSSAEIREVSLGTEFCELRKAVYYFRCTYSVRKARCLHRPYQPDRSPEDLETTKEEEKDSV